jgi:hypothetical protein
MGHVQGYRIKRRTVPIQWRQREPKNSEERNWRAQKMAPSSRQSPAFFSLYLFPPALATSFIPTQPSSATMASSSVPAPAPVVVPKKRGSYNCGRCGLPKKGHVCPVPGAAPKGGGEAAAGELKPRRALHFDDDDGVVDGVTDAVPAAAKRPRVDVVMDYEDEQAPWDGWVELGAGRRVPGEVVVEVLRRLAPRGVGRGQPRLVRLRAPRLAGRRGGPPPRRRRAPRRGPARAVPRAHQARAPHGQVRKPTETCASH